MSRRTRLEARIQSVNERLKRIRTTLSKLELSYDLETRVEERLRLDSIIADRRTDVENVETELEELETQLAALASEPLLTSNRTPSPSTARADALQVFLSYAHADHDLKSKFVTHLRAIERLTNTTVWHDGLIQPGAEWDEEIRKAMRAANIILLLVSPDFIASDYIWNMELQIAMERHDRDETVVVPIILRPCAWSQMPFSRLQALPKQGKPITTWSDPDTVLDAVVQHLSRLIETMNGQQQRLTAS